MLKVFSNGEVLAKVDYNDLVKVHQLAELTELDELKQMLKQNADEQLQAKIRILEEEYIVHRSELADKFNILMEEGQNACINANKKLAEAVTYNVGRILEHLGNTSTRCELLILQVSHYLNEINTAKDNLMNFDVRVSREDYEEVYQYVKLNAEDLSNKIKIDDDLETGLIIISGPIIQRILDFRKFESFVADYQKELVN